MEAIHPRRTPRRLRGAAVLVVGLLAWTLAGAGAAEQVDAHNGNVHGSARKVCRIDWRQGPAAVAHLVRCAARTWPVPGGADYAVMVGRCESGLDPRLVYAGHYGVYQHVLRYWPDRAAAYGFEGRSPLNGRANVIVSIRMAHVGGWGPWSCAR